MEAEFEDTHAAEGSKANDDGYKVELPPEMKKGLAESHRIMAHLDAEKMPRQDRNNM